MLWIVSIKCHFSNSQSFRYHIIVLHFAILRILCLMIFFNNEFNQQEKLRRRIHFHGTDRASLLQLIDAKALPERYGGSLEVPNEPIGEPLWEYFCKFEKEFEGNYHSDYLKYRFWLFECIMSFFFLFQRQPSTDTLNNDNIAKINCNYRNLTLIYNSSIFRI